MTVKLKKWEKFLLYSALPFLILGAALITLGNLTSSLMVTASGGIIIAYSLGSAALVTYHDSGWKLGNIRGKY